MPRIMKTRTLAMCCTAIMAASNLWGQITVNNFSFEQPGTGKIKGWNGGTVTDIPGWASDTTAVDSGVESDWPGHTEGLYSGYLMNGDPSVWQLASYAIQSTDNFSLQVDARNNWSQTPPASLSLTLYFDNAGARTVAASSMVSLTDSWVTQTLDFDASTLPASWGKTIGIELANGTSGSGSSWIGMDNVRLSLVPEPSTFALLSCGLAVLALRRRKA